MDTNKTSGQEAVEQAGTAAAGRQDATLCSFLEAEFGEPFSRLSQQLEFSPALQALAAVLEGPGSLLLSLSARDGGAGPAGPSCGELLSTDLEGLAEVSRGVSRAGPGLAELSRGGLLLVSLRFAETGDREFTAKQMLVALAGRVFDGYFKKKTQSELVRMFSVQELSFVGWVLVSGTDIGRKSLSDFGKCRDSKGFAKRVFKVLARSAKRFGAWKRLLEQLAQSEMQDSRTQSQCSLRPGLSKKSHSKTGLVIPVGSPRADCQPAYYSTIETMKCNKVNRESVRSQLNENRLPIEESSTKENSVFFSVNQHSKAAPKSSLPFKRSLSQFSRALEPMTVPASVTRSFCRFSDLHCVATPRAKGLPGRQSAQFEALGGKGLRGLLVQSKECQSNEERELEEALRDSDSQNDLSKIEERIEELRAELAKVYAAGVEEYFARREFSKLGLCAAHREAFRAKLARGEESLVDKVTDLLFDCDSKQLSPEEVARLLLPSDPRTEGPVCEVETYLRSAVRLVCNEGFLQSDLWRLDSCIESGDAEVIEALAEDLIYFAQYKDFKGLVNGLSELLQQL